MKINTLKNSGFTLVEIMTVVGIIGIATLIAIPSFAKATTLGRKNVCLNALRQIDQAKEQWAVETGKANGTDAEPVREELNTYIKGGTSPVCPAGGTYNYGLVGELATCNTPGHVLE